MPIQGVEGALLEKPDDSHFNVGILIGNWGSEIPGLSDCPESWKADYASLYSLFATIELTIKRPGFTELNSSSPFSSGTKMRKYNEFCPSRTTLFWH